MTQNILGKLLTNLPLWPRSRHHIFSGSNTWQEWRMMFGEWFNNKPSDDEKIISQYEQAFADKVNTSHAFSFGAGRMALYAAMEALDIGEGDEVIVPAYTCVVVPNAVLYRGATPIFVDIDADSLNINPTLVEAMITQKTKAIFAQHTFGLPCEVEKLKEIAQRHGLLVIEDAAHALGASYKSQPVGSLGDVAFFSTDHSKVISTFLGGMITTNNEKIAAKLAQVQQQTPFLPAWQHRKLLRSFLMEFPANSPINYWWGKFFLATCHRLGLLFFWQDEQLVNKPQNYPYPARLSSSQALLGISQLALLDSNIAHRKAAFLAIDKLLDASNGDHQESACLRYSFMSKDRGQFESLFYTRWELAIWFTSIVHGRDENLELINYQLGSCPVAEFAAKHVVNFPTHQRTPHAFMIKQISKHAATVKQNIIRYHLKER